MMYICLPADSKYEKFSGAVFFKIKTKNIESKHFSVQKKLFLEMKLFESPLPSIIKLILKTFEIFDSMVLDFLKIELLECF